MSLAVTAPQASGFAALEEPAGPIRELEKKSIGELSDTFKRAHLAGVRAWMLMSICVGVGLERSEFGDRAADGLAAKFGCSRGHAFQLAKLYRDLIKPRLDQEGARARFEIAEQLFYRVASKAASVARKPALQLLEYAEQQRERDPKYSALRFRREVYAEAGVNPGTSRRAVMRLLRRLAELPLEGVDRELLDAAAERIDAARGVVQPA